MSNTQTITDVLIKEKLEKLALPPPNKVWDSIQAAISANLDSINFNESNQFDESETGIKK